MSELRLSLQGSDALADLIGFAQDGVGWKRFDAYRERFRKRVERRALRVLGAYPPERSPLRKFRFATAKSRRWFHANYPEGTQRSGELGRSWTVVQSVTRAGFSTAIGTDADEAQYVYAGADFRQVPGHFDTGWPNIDDQFTEIAAAAETMLVQTIDELIAEALP